MYKQRVDGFLCVGSAGLLQRIDGATTKFLFLVKFRSGTLYFCTPKIELDEFDVRDV